MGRNEKCWWKDKLSLINVDYIFHIHSEREKKLFHKKTFNANGNQELSENFPPDIFLVNVFNNRTPSGKPPCHDTFVVQEWEEKPFSMTCSFFRFWSERKTNDEGFTWRYFSLTFPDFSLNAVEIQWAGIC